MKRFCGTTCQILKTNWDELLVGVVLANNTTVKHRMLAGADLKGNCVMLRIWRLQKCNADIIIHRHLPVCTLGEVSHLSLGLPYLMRTSGFDITCVVSRTKTRLSSHLCCYRSLVVVLAWCDHIDALHWYNMAGFAGVVDSV